MGRRKRKSARNNPLCSVCQNSYPSYNAFIPPCNSNHLSSEGDVCLTCGYQHIFTALSRDITSRIICPRSGCSATIPTNFIESVLLQFNPDFLRDYTMRSKWCGTSEQWVKTFAACCPYCSVPIEKNGGCNQVVCSRCHQLFDWQLAKTSKVYSYTARLNTMRFRNRKFFCILFVLFMAFLLMLDKMNPFGGNAFGGGYPQAYSGPFPPQALGQFGLGGGFGNGVSSFPGSTPFPGGAFSGGNAFSNGGAFPGANPFSSGGAFPGGNAFSGGSGFPGANPFSGGGAFPGGNAFSGGGAFPGANAFSGGGAFPGGNAFPSGGVFPPPISSSGFPSPPIGGQFGQGFGYPAQGFGAQFPPGQPAQFGNADYFGSGSYGRQRPRRSSRHRSGSRHRRSSSSSESDNNAPRRGSPFAPGPANPYANLQPFPNMPPLSPRGGSPILPPRPVW